MSPSPLVGYRHNCDHHTVGNHQPPWITAVARMPSGLNPFKKPGSVLLWMEMWRCDGASFVSMELNGSHVELTRRGAKRNSGPPFVQQWNSDLYSEPGPVEAHVRLPKIDKWSTWSLKIGSRGELRLSCALHLVCLFWNEIVDFKYGHESWIMLKCYKKY